MSWSGTPPKIPKELSERDGDDDFTAEERDRKTTTDFLEEDYLIRVPSTRFTMLRHIENLVL